MSAQQQILMVVLVFAPMFLFLAIVGGWTWWRLRRKTRRPVSDKLLRASAESLRARMDKFDEQFTNNCVWILLYGPAWFLVFALYVRWRLKSPHLGTEMICFGAVMVIVTVWLSRKVIAGLQRYRNDALGFKGERAVGEELNKLMLDGCLVYHDVRGKARGTWTMSWSRQPACTRLKPRPAARIAATKTARTTKSSTTARRCNTRTGMTRTVSTKQWPTRDGWPKRWKAKSGLVTVPEADEPVEVPAATEGDVASHTEIQWLLAKTGNDMGVDVWVARNDRNRQWNGHKFTDLPRLRTELPLQFDEATNRTIE
jgi:hypothetical protein